MKFHCYIEHQEAVYEADVESDNHIRAAEMAAAETRIQGTWTVVQGEPVQVKIREVTTYVAG